MSDERIQQTIEEMEAKTTAALRQKERAEGIAKKWGLPWPEPSRKGQWGRMSREFRMKRELYAKVQRIVEGKEPEPASPPQLPVGSALGAKGNGGEGNGGDGNGSEGNGSEGNGSEGNGSEGNGGEGNGGDGNGGEDGDKDDEVSDHQKLSKLHRPTWVKELFFSLQASQKLSIKDACGWVMENMPSVFCPNGKPLTSSTVCTWKKQLERKETHQTGDTPGKKKRGPKPSHPCGELQQSKTNNTKVPYSLLCILAGMVVAQYNAGFPLSTTLLMPMSGVATLFASWLSQVAQEQLLKGVPPEKLKFDLTLQNDDEIEERDTLYEEARALDRKRELFVVKGGRSKDAAVAGLLEQNTTESSKRKEQEIEMMDVTGSGTDNDFDVNGEKWTEMDELDEGVEARDEDEFDGEESQLPDDLTSCFNLTIQTTRYGRTTAIPSKFKN
ncbi:hypothetical protein EMCRGX_G001373 [Ephydatia muelleri]|eukprot:Em0001g1371a